MSKSLKMFQLFTGIVCLLIVSQNVFAQTPDFSKLTGLGEVRYHKVESEIMEHTYYLFVRLPADYQEDKKYPTVYLLDGGATWPILAAYYNYLHFGEEVPSSIIVGISYGSNNWRKGNMRGRDFTAKSEERDYWGGAPKFQEVFAEEFFPLIEKNYASDASRRVIFGQSLGGQFVLHAAQSAPDLFFGYIASNPALHRNLELFLKMTPEGSSGSDQPRLFVGSGSDDVPRFREPAVKWIEHWSQKEGLPWALKTATLDGHTHGSAVTASFRQGMAWVFPDTKK